MTTIAPKKYNQNANAFSRGNATSGAPICSGIRALANPEKRGVANSSSMMVPCMVNSWLYCSFVATTDKPGSNSWARITRAMTPAMRKSAERGDQVHVPDHFVIG